MLLLEQRAFVEFDRVASVCFAASYGYYENVTDIEIV